MRMRVLAVLVGVLLLALPATPAAAGGYESLDWEGRYLISGERAVTRGTQVLWPTSAAARRAVHKGDYRVYLLPGPADYTSFPQPRRWRGPTTGAVEAPGQVTLRHVDANMVAVRAIVRIPDVSPGRYHAVLCTPGCRRLPPYMWPSDITVVASTTEARLIARFDRQAERSERMLEQLRGSVDRRIRYARVSSVNTDDLMRRDIDEARDGVARLTGALDRLAANRDRDVAALRRLGSTAAASGLALLALCAGLSVALWRAKRQAPAPPAADDGWERPLERHLVGSRR